MKKWFAFILVGLCLAGCDSGGETPIPGNYEPPFTGPTTINTATYYLTHANGGDSPADPVELAVKISASEWGQLYQVIAQADKFVALDLSRCYDVPTTYSGRPMLGTANDKIVSLILPNGITSFPTPSGPGALGAFQGYTNLRHIILSTSLIEIGSYAFANCTNLTEIDLPASLTKIGRRVFNECSSLTRVTSRATTPPTSTEAVFYGVTADFTIAVPPGSVQLYKTATGWLSDADKIISM